MESSVQTQPSFSDDDDDDVALFSPFFETPTTTTLKQRRRRRRHLSHRSALLREEEEEEEEDFCQSMRMRKRTRERDTMSFEFFPLLGGMNVVPLAWTLARDDDDRRKEKKKKKNDDPGSRRRRLFENEARLACSPFVFFWGGGVFCARARALQQHFRTNREDFWGNFFVWKNKRNNKSCRKSTLKNTTKSTTTTTQRTKNLPLPNTRRTRLRRRRLLHRRRLRVFHRCSGDAHCSVLSTNRESQT